MISDYNNDDNDDVKNNYSPWQGKVPATGEEDRTGRPADKGI